ncbi:NUDIX hydrolase [Pelagerythrobacter rhizovicinus]|uniref:NUDIX domain-containing protein n=1 Tax=Pelagerythrobacter rhizovicinus TaxID=2268576 RepID=A0A4Q2KJ79_9SPHN|nr:NUDIX domain-containing protein [Pelagerythrobacter rhizovicinus]RXZ65265.1 NUDIX domain-containing protein [Pelagerythrobacter rhizovicinus]
MLRLIPASLHRRAYRLAHTVRAHWRRIVKPQLSGCAVIATDIEGRLLLVRLSYGSEAWSLPTGGVRRGEDPERAARRELLEETGCEAHAMKLLGVQEETSFGAPNRVHVFATRVSDTPRPDMREIIEARLFPPHSLPEPLGERTRRRLTLWRERS